MEGISNSILELGVRGIEEGVGGRREGVMYRYGLGLCDWKRVSRAPVLKGIDILVFIIDVQRLYCTIHGRSGSAISSSGKL